MSGEYISKQQRQMSWDHREFLGPIVMPQHSSKLTWFKPNHHETNCLWIRQPSFLYYPNDLAWLSSPHLYEWVSVNYGKVTQAETQKYKLKEKYKSKSNHQTKRFLIRKPT